MFKTLAVSTTALLGAVAIVSTAHAAVGDVFYIAMENHNWTQPASLTSINQIYGNSAAPFINSLVTAGNPNAAMVSYASNYVNVYPGLHPSEPNYVWQEAGVTGPLNDASPYNGGLPTNIVGAPNLSGVLQSKGVGWKVYAEDTQLLNALGQNFNAAGGVITNNVAATSQYEVPLTSFSGISAAYTNAYNGSHQYNYAVKHVGQVFFTATNGGNNPAASNPEAQYYSPLQALGSDLAGNTVGRYNWITPNQYNDMHSALSTSFTYNGVTYAPGTDEEQIALGDNFLAQIVPLIEASQAFKNNGEIVIWNDETEGAGAATAGYTSMEIVISPLAKGNAYTDTIQYTHSNDLRTVQDILGVGDAPLGAAAGAYSMSDLYKPGAIPEPGAWAIMLVGVGFIGGAMRRRGPVAAA